jgi:hypothetical protein
MARASRPPTAKKKPKVRKVVHHGALPHAKIGDFMELLRKDMSISTALFALGVVALGEHLTLFSNLVGSGQRAAAAAPLRT